MSGKNFGEKEGKKRVGKGLKSTRKQIVEISEGVLSKVVDIVLFLVFFNAEFGLGGRPGPGGVYRARDKAFEDWEAISYDSIKRALSRLKKKGWVEVLGRGNKVTVQITKQGRKRLEAIVPFYDEKRVWDGKLYLITYDIPERQRDDRELLRRYLRKIGCGRFQDSVWLTPYNPTGVLRDFIGERGLSGAVVVSCVGKDGNVGQEDARDLVARIFQLEELNDRYADYLEEFGGGGKISRSKAIFDFLSILGDDPQLPFELLPDDWVGGEAYVLFRKICKGG